MAISLEVTTVQCAGSMWPSKKWALFLALCIGFGNPSALCAKPSDPATIAKINTLDAQSSVAFASGNYRAAEVAHLRALSLLRMLVPDNHKNVAWALGRIGQCVAFQGEFLRAKPILIDVLARYERLGIQASSEAFATRQILIHVLYELDELEAAKTLALQSLEWRKRLNLGDPIMDARIVTSLMHIYIGQGNFVEAERVYELISLLLPSGVSENEIIRAEALSQLSEALLRQGKFQEAERQVREALAIKRRLDATPPLSIADSISILSGVLSARGQHNEALVVQTEAYDIIVKSSGPNSTNAIRALANIANRAHRLGRIDEAIAINRKVTALMRAQNPVSMDGLGQALGNLAALLSGTKDNKEAIELQEEALTLLMQRFPANHPYVLEVTLGLGHAVSFSGDTQRAQTLFEEAVANWESRPEQWYNLKASSKVSLARGLFANGARAESYDLQRQVGADLLQTFGARSGIDLESQSEFRKWQWVFLG